MGHKRKASDSVSPHPISSFPFSPPTYNSNSPQPLPSQFHPQPIYNTPPSSSGSSSSNHLNSRTHKRHRDNRPNESTIHQTTLEKLYAAQQRQRQGEAGSVDQGPDTVRPALTPSRTLSGGSLEHDLESAESGAGIDGMDDDENDGSAAEVGMLGREKGQASLHSFFRGSGSNGSSNVAGQHNHNPTDAAARPPNHSTAAAITAIRCEDCSAPLPCWMMEDEGQRGGLDEEMMDVDSTPGLHAGHGYDGAGGGASSCVNCARRVCDGCVVKGERRVCLNCVRLEVGVDYGVGYGDEGGAVRGSCGMEAGNQGTAPGVGIGGIGIVGGKRWVGGIGWL